MHTTWLSTDERKALSRSCLANEGEYNIRAAWSGTRVILRQVSPEANDIYDLIMALYHKCDGNWDTLATEAQVDPTEVGKFLSYAATFLSNIGNHFVSNMRTFFDSHYNFYRALETRKFGRNYLARASGS